jgi:hypothetical protein
MNGFIIAPTPPSDNLASETNLGKIPTDLLAYPQQDNRAFPTAMGSLRVSPKNQGIVTEAGNSESPDNAVRFLA